MMFDAWSFYFKRICNIHASYHLYTTQGYRKKERKGGEKQNGKKSLEMMHKRNGVAD